MPTPTIDPDDRDPAEVAPTDTYDPRDRVWVHRGGIWRAGVIENSSPRAATVRYRPSSARGTAVDTLTARYLLRRADTDPLLDPRDDASARYGTRLSRRIP
ncbi:MAG: hypothetical protein V7603_4571 [Micromonosporaceae bacterium]|jgi:hypothetical protein